MSAFPSRVAVLFVTHFIDDVITAEYRKLRREAPPGHDVVLLYNTTERPPGEPPPDITVHRFDARNISKLDYPVKKTTVSSFNVELFIINFWLRRPEYDQYWMIEYDMRFSGDWGSLFRHFAAESADLLSTTLFRQPAFPGWANWPSLQPPPGIALAPHEKIGAYMPIFRISQRALAAVHAAYQAGWAGHSECTVPTIVAKAGFSLGDIGGDGEFVRPENINRFYRNTLVSRTHAPGTLVYRPVRTVPGDEANMLWHPVKCAEGMVVGRRRAMLRRVRLLLRSCIAAIGLPGRA